MKGQAPTPENGAARELLIGINADLELNRSTICNLARQGEELLSLRSRRRLRKAGRAWGLPEDQLDKAARALDQARSVAGAEQQRAARLGIRILTWLDSDYPSRLRELDLPPPVLYCRGEIPVAPMIAVVGSRQAEPYGLEVAELFSAHLAGTGLAIVSGFARGVDAAAHRGAIGAEGGSTLAVLGCGLDLDYPRGQRKLRERICRQGALLSEFPLGTSPLARNFPVRNRIIAAFGLGTLVVQAAARSGSLITARLALGLGREVWAIPGKIFDQRAVGPNTLIRDGALLVQHPRDILESLPWSIRRSLPADAPSRPADPVADGPAEAGLLAALPRGEALTPEAIARRCDLAIDEVLRRLLELELVGRVRRYPGPRYSRL
jgi:DNA processing protein